MINQKSLLKPSIELLFAAIFWGFGFVATIWALRFLDTPAVLFYRFLIAFSVGMLFILRTPVKDLLYDFRLSFGAGVLLMGTLIFQTYGLLFTTATKSAFITTLYAVFVPVIAGFMKIERLHRLHFLCVIGSIIGTALIVELQWEKWNFGDSLTLVNTGFACLHILYASKIAPKAKDTFALNVFQTFWCGLFSLTLLALPNSRWNLFILDARAWFGLLSIGLGCSLLAFFLQFKAQKDLPPSLCSILFLLESPFSVIFAVWLLGERLSFVQVLGGILIILSCYSAVYLGILLGRKKYECPQALHA